MIDTFKPKLDLPTKANFKNNLPLLGGADLSFGLHWQPKVKTADCDDRQSSK